MRNTILIATATLAVTLCGVAAATANECDVALAHVEACVAESCPPTTFHPVCSAPFEVYRAVAAGSCDEAMAIQARTTLATSCDELAADFGLPDEGDVELPASDHFISGENWSGYYWCPQGETRIQLQVDGVTGPAVTGVVHFSFANESAGSFRVSGNFDAASRGIDFQPGPWLQQPDGYTSVGFAGSIAPDGNAFAGEITHEECGTIQMWRGDSTSCDDAMVRVHACEAQFCADGAHSERAICMTEHTDPWSDSDMHYYCIGGSYTLAQRILTSSCEDVAAMYHWSVY